LRNVKKIMALVLKMQPDWQVLMDSKDLAKVLEELSSQGKTLYIVGHTGFCYDTLGSAFGLAHIAGYHRLDARVCGEFPKDWGYPQNNILYNRLGLEGMITEPGAITADDPVAFVDVFPDGSNCYDVKGRQTIVINHHPIENSPSDISGVPFVDTREAGSTIAMVADHMMRLGVPLSEDDRDLATLMLYGLRVDTKRYLRQELELDFRVSPFIAEHADMALISKIEARSYPIELLNILKGMNEKEVGKYRIAVVKATKPGMVPQLADMLIGFEGCSISLAVAKVEEADGRKWIVSGRSNDPGSNVCEFIKKQFGTGGGHWHSAGASLTTDEMYLRFGVDESADTSVLRQVLDSLEYRIKALSNER
jgi:nanoRNase/pAp phosphatase (c-di-AMP/oligoRNAs hydrolase)